MSRDDAAIIVTTAIVSNKMSKMIGVTVVIRVPPGHGKSWNLGRPFSRPGKSWKIAKVMESHGK